MSLKDHNYYVQAKIHAHAQYLRDKCMYFALVCMKILCADMTNSLYDFCDIDLIFKVTVGDKSAKLRQNRANTHYLRSLQNDFE